MSAAWPPSGGGVFTPEMHALVLAHYERVAPFLVRSFADTPFVSAFVPDWRTKAAVFTIGVHDAPPAIPTVEVPLRAGPTRVAAVTYEALLWQVHRGAIAFHGWTPTRDDVTRARFGRIVVEPHGTASVSMVKETARLVAATLARYGLRSLVLLGGFVDVAIWIPFDDAPPYAPLRRRLDALCVEVARSWPDLVTTARPLAERGDRVHLSAESNAVGRFSALPYALRALDALPVVTPVTWDELDEFDPGAFDATSIRERLDRRGDVFATSVDAIGAQSAAAFVATGDASPAHAIAPFALFTNNEPKGRIIQAAIAILEDGSARDADALLAEAVARGLVPASTTRKDVYTELIEYISRAKGHDRTPKIVQDPDRRFRRNLPADDWPAPQHPPATPAPAADAETIVARLASTAKGDDPALYEQAVCDAFAALGFVATHLGGEAAPDGYLDAPLGAHGYRTMLECKRAIGIVQQPDAAEAAKYVAPYGAQHAALVGPAFGDDTQLAGELRTHGVTAFTNDDLARLLRANVGPGELRAAFAPGFAADAIEVVLWERDHGERKRVALVAEIVADAAWQEQLTTAKTGDAADAPRLGEDAAMMLVDQRLLGAEGSTRPCTRDEVRAAFAYLANPLVGDAELDADGTLTLLRAPAADTPPT